MRYVIPSCNNKRYSEHSKHSFLIINDMPNMTTNSCIIPQIQQTISSIKRVGRSVLLSAFCRSLPLNNYLQPHNNNYIITHYISCGAAVYFIYRFKRIQKILISKQRPSHSKSLPLPHILLQIYYFTLLYFISSFLRC